MQNNFIYDLALLPESETMETVAWFYKMTGLVPIKMENMIMFIKPESLC